MEKEIQERFDKIDDTLGTLTNMMTDLLGQVDERRKAAQNMKVDVAQQVAMAKKVALSNPMIRNNPQAKKQVEDMFSAIPGGSKK